MISAQAARISDFIHLTHWDDLPTAVQEQVIKCAIDLFGAVLAGTVTPMAKIGRSIAQQYFPGSDASILLCGGKASLVGTTFANAMAANALDLDDGLNIVKGHPGAVVFPAVLAANEQKETTIPEFLTSLVVGYEISIRMGLALQTYYDFYHSSGAWGASGAAAGAARLLALTQVETLEALGIAEYNAPLTPVMRTVEFPSMNKDGVAWGSMAGMLAVVLAKAGATGRPSLLEMENFSILTATLGAEYEMLNLYFKPYSCCRWAHPAINAVIDLMHQYNFGGESVRQVNIRTFRAATHLFRQIPQNTEEAQYNIIYPIAAAIVAGEVGPNQVLESGFTDPLVIDLMNKIIIYEDADFEKQFPEKRYCEVQIELTSGDVLESSPYQPFGEPSDHIDLGWIVEKFHRITKQVVSTAQANQLIDLLTMSHGANRISQIFDVLGKGP